MIKFPKVHIAESVVNRILNVRDALAESSPDAEAGTQGPGAAVASVPAAVPDPTSQGVGIEEAIGTMAPAAGEMGPPGSDSAQAVGSVLSGGSALQGLINARTKPQ